MFLPSFVELATSVIILYVGVFSFLLLCVLYNNYICECLFILSLCLFYNNYVCECLFILSLRLFYNNYICVCSFFRSACNLSLIHI